MCALALVLGECVSFYKNFSIAAILFIFGVAVFYLFGNKKNRVKDLKISFWYGAAFICFFAGFILFGKMSSQYNSFSDADGKEVTVTGKFIKYEEKSNSNYYYLDAENSGKIIISNDDDLMSALNLKIGNTIKVTGIFDDFSSARNYGNFDENEYYHSLGIYARINADASDILVINSRFSLVGETIRLLKAKLINSIKKISDDNQVGFFMAICTGDKTDLDSELKSLFQENGIAHILAISGLHISLLGNLIFNLLRKRFGLLTGAAFSSIIMAAYCIMCGFTASAVRASIMFAVMLLALICGKKYDILSALSFAVIFILISNPYFILNTGFVYSVVAIFAICIFDEIILKYMTLEKSWAKKLFSGIFLILVLTPVSMISYFYIPTYSAILNLIVLPLLSIIFASAMCASIAGIFSVFMGKFLIGIGSWSVSFIEALCVFIRKLPGSVIITGAPNALRVFVYYVVLAIFCLIFRYLYLKSVEREYRTPGLGFKPVAFVLMSSLLIFIALIKFKSENLNIIMLDVNQGECIIVKSPSGMIYMVDGGSTGVENVGEYRIKNALHYMGISEIDYLIVTHPDSDHTNGLIELLEDNSASRIVIDKVLIPDFKDNENYKDFIYYVDKFEIKRINISSGDLLDDGNIRISFLHPDILYSSNDSNNGSAVFLLEFKDFTALFTGDIDISVEKMLLSSGVLSEYFKENNLSLLKVPHHGSRYSSSFDFLDFLNPSYALISAGENNVYGHPSAEVLERIDEIGSDIYVTAEVGEIIISVQSSDKVDILTKF